MARGLLKETDTNQALFEAVFVDFGIATGTGK